MSNKLAVLAVSSFIPGVGQAYKGRWLRAVLWAIACLAIRIPLSVLMSALAIILLGFNIPGKVPILLSFLIALILPGLLAGWDANRLSDPTDEVPHAGLKRGAAYAAAYVGFVWVAGPWLTALYLARGTNQSPAAIVAAMKGTPEALQTQRRNHFRGILTPLYQQVGYVYAQDKSYGTAVNLSGSCVDAVPGSLFSRVGHPPPADSKGNPNRYSNVVGYIESFTREAKDAGTVEIYCYSTPAQYAVEAKIPGEHLYECFDSSGNYGLDESGLLRSAQIAARITAPSCQSTAVNPPDAGSSAASSVQGSSIAPASPQPAPAQASQPPAQPQADADRTDDALLQSGLAGKLGNCRVSQGGGACRLYVKVGGQGFPHGSGCAEAAFMSQYGCTGSTEQVAACLLRLALGRKLCY